MDDSEFGRTKWGVAEADGEIEAVVMEYHGLSPQPLFVMGDPVAIRAILADTIRTRIAYLAARPGVAPAIADLYEVDAGAPMLRMWVDRASFIPVPGFGVSRLDGADTRHLNRLYELGITQWLPAESVSSGVYYGVRRGGRLVAAAGTHVISRQYGIAAVGNVFTARDARGQGLGQAGDGCCHGRAPRGGRRGRAQRPCRQRRCHRRLSRARLPRPCRLRGTASPQAAVTLG